MLTAFSLISSLLGTKFGKILAVVLVVGGLLFVVFAAKTASRKMPPPVISLLSKIEYMQQLELVRFYSNHILMLGDPDEMQQLARTAASDSLAAKKAMETALFEKGKAEMELGTAQSKLDAIEDRLSLLQNRIDSMEQKYNFLSQREDELIADFSNMKDAEIKILYGDSVSQSWIVLNKVMKASYPKTKDRRRAEKEPRKDFNKLVSSERKRLFTLLKNNKQELSKKEKELGLKKAEAEVEKLEGIYKKAEDSYHLATAAFKAKVKVALEARDAVIETMRERDPLSNTVNPKLLAIVPAITTAYIDLGKITYGEPQDGKIAITVDSIIIDKPLVVLDNSQHWDISNGKPQVSKTEGGIYYEIFEQIRLALTRIESEALQKSLDNGMMLESCKGVEEYFKNMLQSFGYKAEITFRTSQCNCLNPATEAASVTGNAEIGQDSLGSDSLKPDSGSMAGEDTVK
ncbi:MAG: DUF4230 domain-containing protein [Bacteroidia bacterium]|nr:DUF4230 domain-containing protein [Bacteroidia bacterium]